jgi:phospholipid/cholesterol/gamma-HCH transport system substrate-binding protein
MPALVREHVAEAIAGLLVVLVAGWFLAFAWGRTGGGAAADSYALTARFPNSAGITIGSDVRVSGLKIGTVTAQTLDPKTYQALLTLSIDRKVKLPADSSAAITSEGLLGGSFIALIPGGDTDYLRPGDEITDTQGATDLMGLIGSFINRSPDKGGGAGSAESKAGAGPGSGE